VAGIDLVIVPGLGFDRHGHRIGRGRGFYDRFLAHRDWRGISCGFAIQEQIVEQVPVNEKDVGVNMLVTDSEINRFDPHPAPTA
jgi:5-formyltetrahydrofolate cyclo-ligase